MSDSFTIHDLPTEERPRERLAKHGAPALSAQELIALVLGRGIAGESVMTTANNLLKTFGSLGGIVNASLEDLQQIRGLGIAKASQLKACLEISQRVSTSEISQEQKRNNEKGATTPEDIFIILQENIRDYTKEHYFVLSLDNRNRSIGIDKLSTGTLSANLVHPRETFDTAIKRHAACIAIAHNHPSGDPQPSEADITITERIKKAGELMGIPLLDHIIISKTRYYSFKQNGLI